MKTIAQQFPASEGWLRMDATLKSRKPLSEEHIKEAAEAPETPSPLSDTSEPVNGPTAGSQEAERGFCERR